MIDECLQAGITPIVTLYHFDLPAALAESGGWLNRETITAYVDYSRIVFEAFGDRVRYWLTINEQNMLVLANQSIVTGQKSLRDSFQENHHMMVAQAKVIKAYHDAGYLGKIGPAPNIAVGYAASSAPADIVAAQWFNSVRNWLFLDPVVFGHYQPQAWQFLQQLHLEPKVTSDDLETLAAGRCDFITFNYYNSNTVAASATTDAFTFRSPTEFAAPGFFKAVDNPRLPHTQFGWEIDPVGLRVTLHELYNRYDLPLLITENGIGGEDELDEDGYIHDQYRIDYLAAHIAEMTQAVSEGVELLGYCPWSALDLISTHEGMKKRYGVHLCQPNRFGFKGSTPY